MNLISIFRRLFLPLVVLLLAATAGAQSAYDEIKADIDKAGGVYFMYPFDTPSATPAPKGYEPFYISHYGRHGARYILSNDQYDNVAEVLRRARADGKLTARGIDACDRFLAIYPHLKGRAGDLTPKGQMQHRRLAGRMYAAYPEIFRRHPRIEAYSTVVPRWAIRRARRRISATRAPTPPGGRSGAVSARSVSTLRPFWCACLPIRPMRGRSAIR